MSRTVPRTVPCAIREAEQQLRDQGFKETSIKGYRWAWDHFAAYAVKQGKRFFSATLVRRFMKAMAIRKPSFKPSTFQCVRRGMRVLQEHVAGGKHRRVPLKGKRRALPSFMEKAVSRFANYMRDDLAWSEKTIRNRVANVRFFLLYVRRRGVSVWRRIAPAHIMSYLATIADRAINTRVAAINSIRPFLRFLFINGALAEPIHERFPRFRQERGRRLFLPWTKEEIRKTLAAVDRKTPSGKRAYAILMLAARLGMRAGDIRKLRLENLHWDQSFIEIVQEKTKVPLRLPICNDVGDALADYLRHARPATTRREVFLTRLAPYEPLGRNNNLYVIPQQHRAKAGLVSRKACGLHSLRHTLATHLLAGGVRLDSIGGVLGHRSLDTTSIYLRFDADSLRQAGLDPDKEVRHA